MICSQCKGAQHGQCMNEGKDTHTWCDCQHRAPGFDDVVVVTWVKDDNGVTRKVEIEDVITRLREADVRPDLVGVPEVDVPGRDGLREASDPQEVEVSWLDREEVPSP